MRMKTGAMSHVALTADSAAEFLNEDWNAGGSCPSIYSHFTSLFEFQNSQKKKQGEKEKERKTNRKTK
jgi:hypothetical protein